MDATEAAHQAAVAALLASGAITGATVYSHAPQDAQMPLVIIADIGGVRALCRAGDPDSTLTLTVLTLTEAEEKASCLALQAQIRAALDGKTLSVTGWKVSLTLDEQATELDEQGLGYVGTSRFTGFALTS